MPIAVTEEHESLRRTAERWLQTHCPPAEPRAVAEATATGVDLPAVWEKMAAQGWLGLHLPDASGGEGFTLGEVAVVLEELGRALFPGPVLPTLVVSAAVSRHADEAHACGAAAGPGRRHHHGVRGARRRRPPIGRRRRRASPSPAWCAPSSGCPRRGSCSCRWSAGTATRNGASWTARTSVTRCQSGHSRPSTPPGHSGCSRSRGRCWCPADRCSCPTQRCVAWRWSWPRRRARGSHAGASRRRRSTPRCGCSSAGPSASSRRSSTAGRHARVRGAVRRGGLGRRGGVE